MDNKTGMPIPRQKLLNGRSYPLRHFDQRLRRLLCEALVPYGCCRGELVTEHMVPRLLTFNETTLNSWSSRTTRRKQEDIILAGYTHPDGAR